MKKLLILLALVIVSSCGQKKDEVTTSVKDSGSESSATMYFNGDIITMEGDSPQYVEAIVVKGGKILFAGSKNDAMKQAGSDHKVVDLKGKTMLPGFLDAHSHYINSLLVANQCKLYAPPSGPAKDVPTIISELQKFVKEKNIQKGEMIMGYGYDENVMPDGVLLNRDDLDKAFPDNPVRIDHVSMHGAVMNSLALKKYGISAQTKTPPGGVIVRKPGTDEPYGLIMETAFLPVFDQAEPMSAQQEIDFTRAGQMLYAESGVTTAHEGATHMPQFETIMRASDAGANIIDIVAYPFITEVDKVLGKYPLSEWLKYKNKFKIGGVKITLDGSPQGKTAFFTKPYLTGGPGGEKNWTGEPTFPQDLADQGFKKVYEMNVPLLAHCNGDAAIDLFLKAYEFARDGDYSRPWNVTTIHSQFLRKDQIPKFVQYKIRPSFYTLHTFYFSEAHINNRGKEQAMYISPMRDAIDSGLRPTNHTDFVVAPLDQMMMLYSAVNRISRAGAEIGPDQKVTPYEGLKAMTEWVAEQYGEIDSKGTLKAGKLADLVILDKNPLKIDPADIKDIKVLETIKDGITIFPPPSDGFKPIKVADTGKKYTWTIEACDMAGLNQAANKDWILTELNGIDINSQNPPTINFGKGKLNIFSGINKMSASYVLIDNSVTLSPIVGTKKAGDPKLMELENNLTRTLASVETFNVDGDKLTLSSKGNVVATFRTGQ